MKAVLTRLILALIFVLSKPAFASENFQYWSWFTFNTFKVNDVKFSTYVDFRLDENKVAEPYIFLTSEKISYAALKHLNFGTNFTFLGVRKTDAIEHNRYFQHQFRFEVEANTKWQIKRVKIDNRNRVEFRLYDNTWENHTRFRQRFEIDFAVKNNRLLKAVYFSNESFYRFSSRKFEEFRTIPIGLKLDFNRRFYLKTFYLIQSRKSGPDWRFKHILGTSVVMTI